jgi:hypothetical protein
MKNDRYMGKFTEILLERSPKEKKAWRIRVNYNGARFELSGGEAGKENVWGKEPNKTAYFARHGSPKNLKQFINALNWLYGSKIGQKIKVPDFLIKNHLKQIAELKRKKNEHTNKP